VEDAYGCAQDTIANTLAFPNYSLGVIAPALLCGGETGTLELNLVPAGNYDIEWNGVANGNLTYDVQAGSEVNLLVTDAFGCEKDTFFTFEAFPDFTYTLTNSDIVCPGEPATIEIDYTPEGVYTVLWNGNSGDANIYNTEAGASMDILITDAFGCQKDTSLTINSYPPFNVAVTSPGPTCPGETVAVSIAITPTAAYTIEWNGEELIQTSYSTESGSEVSIQVTDAYECVSDTTVLLEAYPEPIASFSIDQIGDCIPFEDISNITFINNSINGSIGTWDFGDGRTSSFSPGDDAEHSYAEAGTYVITLDIMSADGCTDTTTQELCALPEQPVFIPDIFSPNDDGKNDVLYVRGKLISRLEFRVYSRWGEVVFETKTVSLGWDGRVRGVPAPSGSYYYTITATVGSATRVEEVGEIVLIR
jgi:gliding motility-associated-like protein